MTADRDLTEAVDVRLDNLRRLAERRAESRKAARSRLKARRDVGLQRRHAARLDREGNGQ